MNGRERVEAALAGDWPDRRPVVLHNFMHAAHEAGVTMKAYRSSAAEIARAHIEAVEKYELDGVLVDIDTALLASAVGVPVDYPDNEPARAVGQLLADLDEVPNLPLPEVEKSQRIQVSLEAVCRIREYFGDEIFIRGNCDQGPFSLASLMRSLSDFMMDLALADSRIFDLLEYTTKACLQYVHLMADTEAVDMLSGGDSTAGPDMVSPEMYRTYALPYEARLVESSHSLGLPYMLHICGNTQKILKDMPESGLDAVELDYKTPLESIHREYADRLLLSGTIDPVGVLMQGSPEDIGRKVAQLLSVYQDSPRLIVNAGCAIPPGTPSENVRSLVEAARSGE